MNVRSRKEASVFQQSLTSCSQPAHPESVGSSPSSQEQGKQVLQGRQVRERHPVLHGGHRPLPHRAEDRPVHVLPEQSGSLRAAGGFRLTVVNRWNTHLTRSDGSLTRDVHVGVVSVMRCLGVIDVAVWDTLSLSKCLQRDSHPCRGLKCLHTLMQRSAGQWVAGSLLIISNLSPLVFDWGGFPQILYKVLLKSQCFTTVDGVNATLTLHVTDVIYLFLKDTRANSQNQPVYLTGDGCL